MKISIEPSVIKGSVQAPPSKSSMQRALAAALLHKGKTVIQNAGLSDDDKAAIAIIKKLGAEIQIHKNEIEIQSEGFPQGVLSGQKIKLHCDESGLSLRLFAAIAALHHEEIILDGEGSLQKRPIQFIKDALTILGVNVITNQGHLPMTIQGPLNVQSLEVDGAVSSQFLSGLLMAVSAAGAEDVAIHVKDLKSKPYIDLTLAVMKHFCMPVPENKNYETFVFKKMVTQTSDTKAVHYTVEGDWSGCAFLLVAGAIAGPVTIHGLDLTSTQADKKIMDALMEANAAIAVEAKGIK
nr:3-phosphoshikimate 1-carboxyvinyltransferase [Chitinophagaceae bacterium]